MDHLNMEPPPGQAYSKADEKHVGVFYQTAFSIGFIQGNRYCGRRGVPVPVDVRIHLLHRDMQVVCQTSNDPDIGLVRDNECYQSVVTFSRSKTVARDEKLYKPFSQPQHIVVGQFSAHLIAGEGLVE